LVELFTPFSSGKININTAAASALEMIPEVDENIARAIIQIRAGPDGTDGTLDDVPFRNVGELINVPGLSRNVVSQLSRYCDVRSHTFEVEVEASLNGVTRKYIAVIRRNPQNLAQFTTLNFYWK
jgi:type II secretory pathway component PulK